MRPSGIWRGKIHCISRRVGEDLLGHGCTTKTLDCGMHFMMPEPAVASVPRKRRKHSCTVDTLALDDSRQLTRKCNAPVTRRLPVVSACSAIMTTMPRSGLCSTFTETRTILLLSRTQEASSIRHLRCDGRTRPTSLGIELVLPKDAVVVSVKEGELV